MVEFNRYEIEHDSFGGFIPVRCWVTDDFKLVLNLFTSDELYDRRNDPNEMHNLIDDIRFADVRSKMHDALLVHGQNSRSVPQLPMEPASVA